jgi:hypothetical protein
LPFGSFLHGFEHTFGFVRASSGDDALAGPLGILNFTFPVGILAPTTKITFFVWSAEQLDALAGSVPQQVAVRWVMSVAFEDETVGFHFKPWCLLFATQCLAAVLNDDLVDLLQQLGIDMTHVVADGSVVKVLAFVKVW